MKLKKKLPWLHFQRNPCFLRIEFFAVEMEKFGE